MLIYTCTVVLELSLYGQGYTHILYTLHCVLVQCWETVIGQKFYELTLFAFVISTIGTIIVDTGRK